MNYFGTSYEMMFSMFIEIFDMQRPAIPWIVDKPLMISISRDPELPPFLSDPDSPIEDIDLPVNGPGVLRPGVSRLSLVLMLMIMLLVVSLLMMLVMRIILTPLLKTCL